MSVIDAMEHESVNTTAHLQSLEREADSGSDGAPESAVAPSVAVAQNGHSRINQLCLSGDDVSG
jgi:hypothetical protein